MTLPDTSFVCKNIDVVWWCEEHVAMDVGLHVAEGICIIAARREHPELSRGNCRMVERGLVDLSEVIPAEVESTGKMFPDPNRKGILRYQDTEQRYVTPWQPVVSDKE